MSDPVHVDELATYLACPRQHEFEFVSGLTGDERWNQDEFRQLLRETICTGLTHGLNSGEDPHEVADTALDSRWNAYIEHSDHHSDHQVTTERSRAQAAIDAYFESVGGTHFEGIKQADDLCDISVVGPDISLTASINGQSLAVDVDYLMVDSGLMTGVRLTERLWGCRVPWANKTDVVSEHFDQGEYRPRQVGTVFAARVVEEALSKHGGNGAGAELLYLSVMENIFETQEAFRAEIDQQWMGDYLDESRQTVDDAINWLCSNMADEVFSPEVVFDEQEYWNGSFEKVVEKECRYCSYAAGCQNLIRREVMFNV